MSDSEKEDDSTPVTREHVQKFLQWYSSRVRLPKYLGFEDHWFHALQTLTLGELRNGIRRLQSLSGPTYVEPVNFWHLSKSMRAPAVQAKWRALREQLKEDKTQENAP